MKNSRENYGHGSHYEENGEEYMDDHINGVDWHTPSDEDVLNEDGSWKDDWSCYIYRKRLLKREYPKADIFILPTLGETYGFVPVEAMGFGLPVVSTDLTWILPAWIESRSYVKVPRKPEPCQSSIILISEVSVGMVFISSPAS